PSSVPAVSGRASAIAPVTAAAAATLSRRAATIAAITHAGAVYGNGVAGAVNVSGRIGHIVEIASRHNLNLRRVRRIVAAKREDHRLSGPYVLGVTGVPTRTVPIDWRPCLIRTLHAV